MGNATSTPDLPVLDLPEGADAGFGGEAVIANEEQIATRLAAAAMLNVQPPQPTCESPESKAFTVTTTVEDGKARELLVTVKEYTFGKTLGQGGFGKVVLATSSRTGHSVAVKIIKRKKLKERTELLLQREVLNHKSLRHGNIVRLFTWISTPQRYYLLMECCELGDLLQHLNVKGSFSNAEARDFFRQLLDGLSFCHSLAIYHRDLKLENLMLAKPELEDARPVLKIADFGLSVLQPLGSHLDTHCGSPLYAAPELMKADGEYDGGKSDMWSCGVILFAMLAAALPFDAQDMGDLVRLIQKGKPVHPLPRMTSQEAKQLVKGLLTVEPSLRLSVAQALEHPWVHLKSEALKASQSMDTVGSMVPDPIERRRSAPTELRDPILAEGLCQPTEEEELEDGLVDPAGDDRAQPSPSPRRGVSQTSAFFREMLERENAVREAEADAADVLGVQAARGEEQSDEAEESRQQGTHLTRQELQLIKEEKERLKQAQAEAGDAAND